MEHFLSWTSKSLKGDSCGIWAFPSTHYALQNNTIKDHHFNQLLTTVWGPYIDSTRCCFLYEAGPIKHYLIHLVSSKFNVMAEMTSLNSSGILPAVAALRNK
ncbi:beta-1,3-galactosyltransferase 1 isoform X2 [Caretta caretta]|uniref:beta-1,3-galactosyltransferase 1 isoform X2 n=1 Tax=Caretta caretta TaxID=8467 RepID=UPI003F4C0BC7